MRAILGPVDRRIVEAVSPMAATVGYSRAVRVGDVVSVAGTAPVMPDDADPPPDPYGQARRCLEIIVASLAELGAGPDHVVRTRVYLTRAEDWPEVGRAHGEVFGSVRPASTMVVASLLDPKWLVEIEADAIVA
jgi:enamine deaminase RidA (YjgF/YER057c/UK114 family)